jgi:hypothetical protein
LFGWNSVHVSQQHNGASIRVRKPPVYAGVVDGVNRVYSQRLGAAKQLRAHQLLKL